jgi:hypothetical protein
MSEVTGTDQGPAENEPDHGSASQRDRRVGGRTKPWLSSQEPTKQKADHEDTANSPEVIKYGPQVILESQL